MSESSPIVADYYRRLFDRHGPTLASLDWGSAEGQRRRFEVIAELGDFSGASVLDVGCGLGDLLGWFRVRGVDVDYTGIDLVREMVESARDRHAGARFEQLDLLAVEPDDAAGLLGRFDFVVASGVFQIAVEDSQARMAAMLERMFALADRGVAANALSAATDGDPHEHTVEAGYLARMCAVITPWWALRHDYAPHDVTAYLYRDQLR